MAVPFAAGFGIGVLMGLDLAGSVFLGAALTATSVGITSRALGALGALGSRAGRVILGAAIIDDVLAMLILAVAVGLAAGGVSIGRIALLIAMAVAFIGVTVLAGTGILRRHRSLLTVPHFAETPFLPGMILMLGLAALAAWIGLAAIIGAFLAGMVVGESAERDALEEEVAPVAAFFTPFFFGSIGAQIDLAGLASAPTLGLLVGVSAVAVVAKFGGAFLGGWSLPRGEAVLVGWGMVPRGEVGIVVAGLGFTAGAISGSLYSVVVGMAVATTLLVPPLLPRLVRHAAPAAAPAAPASPRTTPERTATRAQRCQPPFVLHDCTTARLHGCTAARRTAARLHAKGLTCRERLRTARAARQDEAPPRGRGLVRSEGRRGAGIGCVGQ